MPIFACLPTAAQILYAVSLSFFAARGAKYVRTAAAPAIHSGGKFAKNMPGQGRRSLHLELWREPQSVYSALSRVLRDGSFAASLQSPASIGIATRSRRLHEFPQFEGFNVIRSESEPLAFSPLLFESLMPIGLDTVGVIRHYRMERFHLLWKLQPNLIFRVRQRASICQSCNIFQSASDIRGL
jgi:hypothetical protein